MQSPEATHTLDHTVLRSIRGRLDCQADHTHKQRSPEHAWRGGACGTVAQLRAVYVYVYRRNDMFCPALSRRAKRLKIKRIAYLSIPIRHRPRHSRDERHIEGQIHATRTDRTGTLVEEIGCQAFCADTNDKQTYPVYPATGAPQLRSTVHSIRAPHSKRTYRCGPTRQQCHG